MNDTISQLNTGHSKSSTSELLSGANARHNGRNSVDSANTPASENSFRDTIRKAREDYQPEADKQDVEDSGKDLPLSKESTESAADDDRSTSSAEFNTHGAAQDKQAEEKDVHGKLTAPAPSADGRQVVTAENENNSGVSLTADQAVKSSTDGTGGASMLVSRASRPLMHGPVSSGPDSGLYSGIGASSELPADTKAISAAQASEKLTIQNRAIRQINTEQFVSSGQASPMLDAGQQVSLLSQSVSALPGADSNIAMLPGTPLTGNSALNLQSLPQAEVTESFTRPAWSQGFGKQIVWMVNQNISSAEVKLNPAHLGPVEVFIDMSDDQVNVSMTSRHAVVREAMEQALPKLREMLEANGFNLADADISQHSFSQQREQYQENSHVNKFIPHPEQIVTSEINGSTTHRMITSISMVDYYI